MQKGDGIQDLNLGKFSIVFAQFLWRWAFGLELGMLRA